MVTVKPNEDFTVKINRYVAAPIVEVFARIPFMTPNVITLIGILIAILASWFYAQASWPANIIAGILVYIAALFDLIDGDVARKKGIGTKFGRWYDSLSDKLKGYIVLTGVSLGTINTIGEKITLTLSGSTIHLSLWFLTILAIGGALLVDYAGLMEFFVFIYDPEDPVNKEQAGTQIQADLLFLFSLINLVTVFFFATLIVVWAVLFFMIAKLYYLHFLKRK